MKFNRFICQSFATLIALAASSFAFGFQFVKQLSCTGKKTPISVETFRSGDKVKRFELVVKRNVVARTSAYYGHRFAMRALSQEQATERNIKDFVNGFEIIENFILDQSFLDAPLRSNGFLVLKRTIDLTAPAPYSDFSYHLTLKGENLSIDDELNCKK